MCKLVLVLGLVVVALVVESTCQVKFIHPIYKQPRHRPPIFRRVREAGDESPRWLNEGDDVIRAPSTADHPVLPSIIDDVRMDQNTRHARSLSTPGRGRVGSNDRGSGGSRGSDTGATHPGHNRRNARSAMLPDFVTTPPFNPKPLRFPYQNRRPLYKPIYA